MPGAEAESGTQLDSLKSAGVGGAASEQVAVSAAEFSPLNHEPTSNQTIPLDRFFDVNVRVWAELGRISLPLGDLLKLGPGAVVKLNRPVAEPVELVAQGVTLARGEVVVVDDCFAIRITEIDSNYVHHSQPSPQE